MNPKTGDAFVAEATAAVFTWGSVIDNESDDAFLVRGIHGDRP